jgi:hypothetical protein
METISKQACAHDECITLAAGHENELRVVGVRLNLLPQPCYVNVYCASRRHEIIAPDFAQEFLARDGIPAVLDEVTKRLELALTSLR